MKRWISTSLLSAAVAAAVPFVSSQASAQYRINEDGRALDASNRLGGGGVNPNDSYKRVGEQVPGNDVVTGNVTGGKQFRGHVPYTDPRAFRGNTAGVNIDDFTRQSAGPDGRLAEQTRTFYGVSRAVPPPAGYVQTAPGSGAYIQPYVAAGRSQGDARMGAVDFTNPYLGLVPQGSMLLAGQVDATGNMTYIAASPTAGIRTFGAGDITGMTTNTQYSPAGGRLDANTIQRMRDELNNETGITTPAATPGATPGASPTAPGAVSTPGATPVQGATPIVQQPIAQATVAQPIDTAIAAAPGSAATDQGTRQRLLPSAEKQSPAYAALLKRYQESLNNPTASDADLSRQFNQLQQQAKTDKNAPPDAQANVQYGQGAVPIPPPPGAAAPGAGAAAPGAAGQANATGPGGIPDYAKHGEELLRKGVSKDQQKDIIAKKPIEPIKIPSLSQDMKGKEVAALVKGAEQLMRDGKFTAALDKFDDAERVVPNNPLINLGRANAELGASYYARADSHLRDLFTNHPELLVGQYDLMNMLGEQRLQVLVSDLKAIAKKDQKEPRPLFLLAYIAYNTGHEQDAQAYLDLADKRTGGADPFYKLLRGNWALPAKPATPEAKK